MKRKLWRLPIALMGILFALTLGCKKDNDDDDDIPPPPVNVPVLTTNTITTITSNSAVSGGNITSALTGIPALGVCWSTSHNPTIADNKTENGTNDGYFTSTMSNLLPSTTYYVRAYATNADGTGYGNELSFTTYSANAIFDYDGNLYDTVTIGSQVWLKQNLKNTHYRNGDQITNITNDTLWETATTEGYCNYNNDESNSAIYGRLYNWFAVNDSRGLCPNGYHIPTSTEWGNLINFTGGQPVAGGKLKESGTSHWVSPNTGATDDYGFTALPCGSRSVFGVFMGINSTCTFWGATEISTTEAFGVGMYSDDAAITSYNFSKIPGISVRCIKD